MRINHFVWKCLVFSGFLSLIGSQASEENSPKEVVGHKRNYSSQISQIETNIEESVKKRKLKEATNAVFAAEATAEDLNSLRYCENLKSLNLEHAPPTLNYREILTYNNLYTLEEINFSRKHISDDDLKKFSEQLPFLKKIDLSYTDVKGRGLTNLSILPELQELSLYGNNLKSVKGINCLLENNQDINIFLRKQRLKINLLRIIDQGRVHILENRENKPDPLYTHFFVIDK